MMAKWIFFLIIFWGALYSQTAYQTPTYRMLRAALQQVGRSAGPEALQQRFPSLEIRDDSSVRSGVPRVGVILKVINRSVVSELLQIGVDVRTITEEYVSLLIPADQLALLERLSGVQKIDIARRTHPYNDIAVPAQYANVANTGGYTGSGVICGIVDTGIDFTHPAFQKSNGTSRILYLWDQTDNTGTPPSGFSGGSEYTQAQINQDLGLGGNHSIVPQTDTEGHGTHVAGSFCGYDSALIASQGVHLSGSAVNANIVFVKTDFYTSSINDGVNYIFQKAAALGKPAVVNLSLGSQIGPHDGTDSYTAQLDQLTGSGKIVVRSAGNNGQDKIHNYYQITGSADMNYSVSATSGSDYLYIDCWYDGADSLTVEIHENGNPIDASATYGNIESSTYYYIDNASGGPDPGNGLNNAYIRILYPLSNSYIRFIVTGDDGDGSTYIHAWMTSTSGVTAEFNTATNNVSRGSDYTNDFYLYTLGNGACGQSIISVGAYMTRHSWQTVDGNYSYITGYGGLGGIMYFSSQGPTRDLRNKPDIAAGGGMILSTLSGDISPAPTGSTGYHPTYTQYWYMQGTSMSSSTAAGAIALILEKNPAWTPSQVISYLQNHVQGTTGNSTTSPKTDPGTYDYAFGYGVPDVTDVADYHTSTLPIPSSGKYSFTSGTLTLARTTLTQENMDSLRVELFLDSLPPNSPMGSKPLHRFYRLTPIQSTGSMQVDMSLYYTQEEFNNSGITADESSLDLYHWSGTQWTAQFGTIDVAGDSLTKTGITDVSGDWAFSSISDGSLPVELQTFTALWKDGKIQLQWMTASEVNNAGFEIWRSSDSVNYSKIADYRLNPELAGYGSSNESHRYLFNDTEFNSRSLWYKLFSVDLDGTVHAYPAVKADMSDLESHGVVPASFYLAAPWPNPFNPIVNIQYGIPATIPAGAPGVLAVFDNLGRRVNILWSGVVEPGIYDQKWNGTDQSGRIVATGIYFIVFKTTDFIQTRKVLFLK